ncbi:protein MID1-COMPLEMENTING ACTIVITY 2-like [Setaria italica]|uniref:protein MID1-COMPLEMENTING ACTIVITY 2-like n=1 Tax=Setaria italica TaxID=4555 RepID=UPI0006492362|nr:protein MID1-COMPLEMENTING ACTIVITY 2-like [Setaria italica]
MVEFWDMVGKAANLLQLFGGDAITLITLVASCFWQFHEVKKECRKLEDSVRMLRLLLLSPAGCWIMQQQNLELLGHLVTNALMDADDLVRSCSESTPSLRVLRGRGMSRQFRDLRKSIDSYCCLILSINGFLLVVQANPPPPSSLVRTQVNHVTVAGFQSNRNIEPLGILFSGVQHF